MSLNFRHSSINSPSWSSFRLNSKVNEKWCFLHYTMIGHHGLSFVVQDKTQYSQICWGFSPMQTCPALPTQLKFEEAYLYSQKRIRKNFKNLGSVLSITEINFSNPQIFRNRHNGSFSSTRLMTFWHNFDDNIAAKSLKIWFI